jgi:hypothetical protein
MPYHSILYSTYITYIHTYINTLHYITLHTYMHTHRRTIHTYIHAHTHIYIHIHKYTIYIYISWDTMSLSPPGKMQTFHTTHTTIGQIWTSKPTSTFYIFYISINIYVLYLLVFQLEPSNGPAKMQSYSLGLNQSLNPQRIYWSPRKVMTLDDRHCIAIKSE